MDTQLLPSAKLEYSEDLPVKEKLPVLKLLELDNDNMGDLNIANQKLDHDSNT